MAQSVTETVEKLKSDGATKIICLSTHMTGGKDYQQLKEALRSSNARVRLSAPILSNNKNIGYIKTFMENHCRKNIDTIYMAHGTSDKSKYMYERLAAKLPKHIHIVSLEEGLRGNSVLQKLDNESVILRPLTIYAGIHSVRDMRGSWKPYLESLGYNVSCVMKGIGEYSEIRALLKSILHSEEKKLKEMIYNEYICQ
jgi:sirohydrochlorin cobaltochelatase